MKKLTKEQQFNELIWKEYSDSEVFDILNQNMLNVRETMLSSQPDFRKFSVQRQFDYCCTIVIIAAHSVSQHINENMPLSKPKDIVYKYSINRPRNKSVTEKVQERLGKEVIDLLKPFKI